MAEKDLGNRLRRAVKENNLAHVKRLVQRVDMRNPDPGPLRYTSLAWAAVCGNEDVFDYLLSNGHDDEELSKDAENNTILILLASLGALGNGNNTYRSSSADLDLRDAAQRMARRYYERYPFILDWSNLQGKTALHVAAIKGNEEFVRTLCDVGADFDMPDAQGNTPLHYASAWGHLHIIQILIERGCQFAAKNVEGFTASDYAYSTTTWDTLQDTARAHYEQKKNARRNVFTQAAQRGNEWSNPAYGDQPSILPSPSDFVDRRIRSGSGSSRIPSDQDSPRTNISSLKSSSSASTLPSRSGQTKVPLQQMYSTLSASSTQRSHPYLAPVATRMREKDADAMAEYMKRSRSGSSSITAIPSSTSLAQSIGENSSPASATPQARLLRPSMSAASLRVMPPLSSSPPDAVAQHNAADSPQKSAPRKLISSRSRRPGTADGVAAPSRKNPFNLLSSRHAAHDSTSSHERHPSATGHI